MTKASGVAPREGARLWAGRYELGERLGAGGLATVYRGRHIAPGGFARPVAIKRLHPHFQARAGHTGDAAMFLDEARIASSIVHPNVVATLDVVAEADEYVVIMELVEGATLERLLSRGAPPLPVALRIVTDALRGLHAAHVATDAAGEPLHVVHRDVAPSNILVGHDGVARISDFGVAKARGRLASTQHGEVKGHLSYMAPEQLVGDAIDARADTFGAGVVLWEALTGRRLFHGETEAQVVYALLERPVVAPRALVPELPEALSAAVMKALEREPAMRFPSARAMADALEAAAPLASAREVAAWVTAHAPADDGDAEGEAPPVAADTWLDAPSPVARGAAGAHRARTRVAFAGVLLAVGAISAVVVGARRTSPAMGDAPAAVAVAEHAQASPAPALEPAVSRVPAMLAAPVPAVPSAAPAPAPSVASASKDRARTPSPAPVPAAARRPSRRATPVRLYARD